MRIEENTLDRLVLAGVPGGAGAMGAFVAIGTVLMVVFGAVFATSLGSGNWARTLFTPIGVIIGACLAVVGGDALCTREQLELDHRAGQGQYTRTHRFRGARRDTRRAFAYADITGVVLERREVTTGSGRSARTSTQWRAILRIDRPRTTILMHESQQGAEAPVRDVAIAVAAALGRDIAEDLDPDDGEDTAVAPEEFTTALAARESGDITLPPQPDGARITVEIDPEASQIRLSWPVLKAKVVLYPFILFFLLWTAVSVFFLFGALGWIGTSQATKPLLVAMSAAFIGIGFAFLIPLVRLLIGARREIAIFAGALWIQQPYSFITRSIELDEITTVRVASGDDDAVIVYGANNRTTRIGLHMPAEGEVAWLASALRASIKAMA